MYEKIAFNKNHYDFLSLIEKFLSEKNDGLTSIDQLGQYFDSQKVNVVESFFYEIFHQESFSKIYEAFVMGELKPIIGQDFYYQAIPSVRINYPGEKSVNFHNDCWYGHGDTITNIWVPLTEVRGTQSLAFLDEKTNDRLLDRFYKEQPPLAEMHENCLNEMMFAECDYGDFLMFPTRSLHGTTKNISGNMRISFDFRISTDGDFGVKNPNFFKSTIHSKNLSQSSKPRKKCIGYLSQLPSKNMPLISQTVQQEAIISHCKKSSFDLVALETELIGFTRPINLEDILFSLRGEIVRDLIIFSDNFLLLHEQHYRDLIERALNLGWTFHFVNEGYAIDTEIP